MEELQALGQAASRDQAATGPAVANDDTLYARAQVGPGLAYVQRVVLAVCSNLLGRFTSQLPPTRGDKTSTRMSSEGEPALDTTTAIPPRLAVDELRTIKDTLTERAMQYNLEAMIAEVEKDTRTTRTYGGTYGGTYVGTYKPAFFSPRLQRDTDPRPPVPSVEAAALLARIEKAHSPIPNTYWSRARLEAKAKVRFR